MTRKERQRVPARGSAVTTAKATIQASIIELFAMGLDCLANDNMTKYVRVGGLFVLDCSLVNRRSRR